MPIRLNLLAEDQAREEMRRRDPVKRAIWIGAFLVCIVLVWSSSLQLRAMIARSDLSVVEAQIATRSNSFATVMSGQKRRADLSAKLDKLRQLAASRLLNGTLLNALQKTSLEDVQLTRLKLEQRYDFTDEVKNKTNAEGRVVVGRPATATEHVVLTLDAQDVGANPGDQFTRFKQAIAANPYFQAALGKTNEVRLMNYLPPQMGPDGKPFVFFTLECRFPDKTR